MGGSGWAPWGEERPTAEGAKAPGRGAANLDGSAPAASQGAGEPKIPASAPSTGGPPAGATAGSTAGGTARVHASAHRRRGGRPSCTASATPPARFE